MNTSSVANKVNEFFNKFEKSAGCEDFLAGTMGMHPVPFDELKVSKDVVIYTDIRTDKANKKYLYMFVAKKDDRFYDEVNVDGQVEIPTDMAEYLEKAKKLALEVAEDIDKKGLVK